MKYFKLYIKKTLKSCRPIILITLAFIVGLALTAYMLISSGNKEESRKLVRIGLVGSIEETYLGVGLDVVKNIDDSRFAIDFLEMDIDEAEERLSSGDISAYVEIPRGFVNSLVNGQNKHLRFVMSKGSAAISSVLMCEVLTAVSGLVTDSQKGIYALIDYMDENGVIGEWEPTVNTLNIQYFDKLLGRASATDCEILGIGDSLSLTEYYICGILTAFLLIFGISCSVLFADKNLALGRLMKSRNISITGMILCEYLAFVMLSCITVLALALIAGTASEVMLPEGLERIDFAWCIVTAVKLVPFAAMLASMQFFLYEAASGIVSGILVQFITSVGLGYISGCFYPSYFFPPAIQTAAAYLPSGLTFGFIRSCVSGSGIGAVWMLVPAYTVVFIVLSVFIRNRRLQRGSI